MMKEHTSIKINTSPSNKKMLGAMASIGVVCAFLIVLTFNGTLERIQKNRDEALKKAIFQVLPDITKIQTFQWNQDQTFSLMETNETKNEKIYVGYDSTDQIKGIAIQANGKGYGDVLNFLYGYDLNKQKVIGFYVLESKETPGIGNKIENEAFMSNFDALDASLNDVFTKLKNEIKTVKQGEKTNPWELDGISGATITSRAVGNILNTSAQQWIPLIYKNKESFLIKNKNIQ